MRTIKTEDQMDKKARRALVSPALMLLTAIACFFSTTPFDGSNAAVEARNLRWIGTWATAAQAEIPGQPDTFQNQTLRLIVHTSAAGNHVRIRISNTFGKQPLEIGGVHVARRSTGPDIEPSTDRAVTFSGHSFATIAAGSTMISDPVSLDVPALSDLAISLFLPQSVEATTSHLQALQTSYASPPSGNLTAELKFPVGKEIKSWPFLTGVDVSSSRDGASIVALGSSLTDGIGSTTDANRRWPDILTERLQKAGGEKAAFGVLNEGIIGNRLLNDYQSQGQRGGPPPLGAVFEQFGLAIGQSGLTRFDRDVLEQASVKYLIMALGVNDILFPGSFIPQSQQITARSLIDGYRQTISRSHKKHIRAIGTTIPPFEHALWADPLFNGFYTPENEKIRQEVNDWIRNSREFDGVIDFDEAVRDPNHPTQLLPAFDSGDHLHVNDAGNVAQGNIIPLDLFRND
jgi:lysophospholipase L1-like esterase